MNEHTMLVANTILVVTYILLGLERIPRVVTALLGAMLMILLGVVDQKTALSHVDWNVIFLLVGMMILVNILQQTGALRWLGLYTAKKAGGDGMQLMIALALLTAGLSALLDNVTTVLFIGSATCAMARELRINPVPFLITQALASNIGGAATLIGDPPNLMIGSAAHLGFDAFLLNVAPVILIILPVCILLMGWIYKNDLALPPETHDAMAKLSIDGVITDRPLMRKALVVLAFVTAGFVFHHALGLEAGTIALSGAAVLMLFERKQDVWNDVEWTTIFFFIGLFMVVGAVEEVGTIHELSRHLVAASQGSLSAMTMAVLWGSGLLSALIDNIPYTATMIPLLRELAAARHGATIEPVWWALSLGACLGGNGTLVGATANIMAADLALRHGHPMRIWDFMRGGLVVMLASLLISTLYLWLRYLV